VKPCSASWLLVPALPRSFPGDRYEVQGINPNQSDNRENAGGNALRDGSFDEAQGVVEILARFRSNFDGFTAASSHW
jgi:hypothetical protein